MRRRKRRNQKTPPKTLEDWIRDLYIPQWGDLQILPMRAEALSSHPLMEHRYFWVQGRGLGQPPLFGFLSPWDDLEKASLLCPLIWLRPSHEKPGEYELPFYFLQPEVMKGRDVRVNWAASSMDLWEIQAGEKTAILMLDRDIRKRLDQQLASEPEFQRALEAFLGNKAEARDRTETVILNIDEPVDFMAGRFFIPLELRRQSPTVQCSVRSVILSGDGRYLTEERGLWYRAVFRLKDEDNNRGLFYFFPGSDDSSSRAGQSAIRVVKMLLRHFRSRLQSTEMEPRGFGGDFCTEPESALIVNSYILEFNLYSGIRKAPVYLILPIPLVRWLLQQITPPWKWVEILDNPENRLRMLFSLDGEIHRQGLFPLLPEHGDKISPEDAETIEDLRLGFITLADIFSLSSHWELRQLISNFLYREGWTGSMLPRLFYYFQWEEIQDKMRPVRYRLAGFNEERLLKAMPKNMADQWPREGAAPGVLLSSNEWCQENYRVLRDIYIKVRKEELFLSARAMKILYESFNNYTNRVEIFVKHQLQHNPVNWAQYINEKQKLQGFFFHYSGAETYALFSYNADAFSRLDTIIPPAKKDSIIQCIRRNKNAYNSQEERFLDYLSARKRLSEWMNK